MLDKAIAHRRHDCDVSSGPAAAIMLLSEVGSISVPYPNSFLGWEAEWQVSRDYAGKLPSSS